MALPGGEPAVDGAVGALTLQVRAGAAGNAVHRGRSHTRCPLLVGATADQRGVGLQPGLQIRYVPERLDLPVAHPLRQLAPGFHQPVGGNGVFRRAGDDRGQPHGRGLFLIQFVEPRQHLGVARVGKSDQQPARRRFQVSVRTARVVDPESSVLSDEVPVLAHHVIHRHLVQQEPVEIRYPNRHQDRIVRSNLVQLPLVQIVVEDLGQVHLPLFGASHEPHLVYEVDPLSRLELILVHQVFDLVQDIFLGPHAAPVHRILLLFGFRQHPTVGPLRVVVHVAVAVDDPRDHRFAFQVDHLRSRTGQRPHLLVGAHGKDFIPGDGHGLGDGKVVVDGEHFSVVQDQRGILRHRARCRSGQPHGRCQYPSRNPKQTCFAAHAQSSIQTCFVFVHFRWAKGGKSVSQACFGGKRIFTHSSPGLSAAIFAFAPFARPPPPLHPAWI